MRYFYGPVMSRRLGISLGVDLVPEKMCSFDCVYCQAGATDVHTRARGDWFDPKLFRAEMKEILASNPDIEHVTIAGIGEPTLQAGLDRIIKLIKDIASDIPVVVITNSSLIFMEEVRGEISAADIVIPSLDSVVPETFFKVNRPCPGSDVARIVEGLAAFRKIFSGQIWLEIMLVKDMNDSDREAQAMAVAVKRIMPDKIQINIPVRPGATAGILPPEHSRIEEYCRILNETAGIKTEDMFMPHNPARSSGRVGHLSVRITDYVKRRPADINEICAGLGTDRKETEECLSVLEREGKIKRDGGFFMLPR